MSIDNLQQAIANAAAGVRTQHPELTQADVDEAYTAYREHFSAREDEAPVSKRPAVDELLLAIWDVIVDRETDHVDDPDGELEDYYAAAFGALLGGEPARDYEHQPIAVSESLIEDAAGPAPVEIAQDAPSDAEPNPIDVEQAEQQGSIYKIRIALDGSQPEIWREMLVPANTPETQVHHYIQAAMGWPGSDDFLFTPPQNSGISGTGQPTLVDLLPLANQDCGYEFDDWYHHMSLKEKLEADRKRSYPVCTAGKGACPPVDSNVKDYNQRVKLLRNPSHPDYEEVAGWVTQDFNPEAFNIEEANRRLGRYGNTGFQAVN